MPEGLVIVRQSDASSSSPGGSIKVFIDARGGLCDCVAVRCQLCNLRQVREGIRRCRRGGFVTVCADNGSVTVHRYGS